MMRMIDFYNEQTTAFQDAVLDNPKLKIEDFIEREEKKISWTRSLEKSAKKGVQLSTQEDYRDATYRPFCTQKLYFDESLIESPGLSRRLFPLPETENLVICLSGVGASKDFSILISDKIPNLDTIEKAQCFPLYWYEERQQNSPTLFDAVSGGRKHVCPPRWYQRFYPYPRPQYVWQHDQKRGCFLLCLRHITQSYLSGDFLCRPQKDASTPAIGRKHNRFLEIR